LLPGKCRLDMLLVERGLFPSREPARRAVLAGEVYVDGQRQLKAGTRVAADAVLEVRGRARQYVSRGGEKLRKALEEFSVAVEGRAALDVGASTGGFTDCLLQHGARHVWAVDVGYGQLDWQLRHDSRVTVLERTNIRYVEPSQVPPVDLVVIDVSFISLEKVLPAILPLLLPGGDIVALVKPQFEAGQSEVGKKGVVREPATHERVLHKVISLAASLGLGACGLTFSPLKGPQGNIEFLVHLRAAPTSSTPDIAAGIGAVVSSAHRELE
jgi:23S rRNA (cytidine1920-2'-O)/16S rRNA (cytidine1409-2'-O)-methyltransferase